LGGLYFVAGKPEWFWLFVKTNTELHTVMKPKLNHLYFYVITKKKEVSKFWYRKDGVIPSDMDSRED
jgi:hypothetical protein